MRTHCHFPHTHTQHVATPQTSRRGALVRQRRWITSATQIPPNLSPLWLKSFWNCHRILWAASRVDCAVCSAMLPAVRCSICGKAWGDMPYSKCNNCGMLNADHHGVCCKKMDDAMTNPPEEPPGAPEQLQSPGPHDWHVPPVPPAAPERLESPGPPQRPHPPVPFSHRFPPPRLPSPPGSMASTAVTTEPPSTTELVWPDLPREPLLPPGLSALSPVPPWLVPPMPVPPMLVSPRLGQQPLRSPALSASTSPVPPRHAVEEPRAVQEQREERLLFMECKCCAFTCIRIWGRLGRQ